MIKHLLSQNTTLKLNYNNTDGLHFFVYSYIQVSDKKLKNLNIKLKYSELISKGFNAIRVIKILSSIKETIKECELSIDKIDFNNPERIDVLIREQKYRKNKIQEALKDFPLEFM